MRTLAYFCTVALFLTLNTVSAWGHGLHYSQGTKIRVIYGTKKAGGPELTPPSDLMLSGLNSYFAGVPNMTVISDAVKYVHRFGDNQIFFDDNRLPVRAAEFDYKDLELTWSTNDGPAPGEEGSVENVCWQLDNDLAHKNALLSIYDLVFEGGNSRFFGKKLLEDLKPYCQRNDSNEFGTFWEDDFGPRYEALIDLLAALEARLPEGPGTYQD